MKHKTTFSIALVLTFALLSLMSSDSRAQSSKQKFFFDTGIMSPGPHESIRLTVNAGAGSDTITVRFMETDYMKGPCDGSLCKYTVKSENTSAPLMLAPGEGASLDLTCEDPFPAAFARGVVMSNSRNTQVTVQIIDTLTGHVVVAFKPNGDITTVGQ